MADTRLVVQVLPVGVGVVALVERVLILFGILAELREGGTIHHGILVEYLLECNVAVVAHLGGSTLRTLLGGDDNHTVGTAATVDSGGRGILQDVHRLDVGRIDVAQLAHEGNTVEHNQRVVAGRERALATNADLHFGTRLRTGLRHHHTGHAALQSLGGVGGCNLIQFLTANVGHRTRYGLATLRTVTNHHHLVHHMAVFLQHNVREVGTGL